MSSENLNQWIEQQRERIARKVENEKRQAQEELMYDLQNQASIVAWARGILPDAIGECISFSSWQDSYVERVYHTAGTLLIEIPQCAPIFLLVSVDMTDDCVIKHIQPRPQGWGAYVLGSYSCEVDEDLGCWQPILRIIGPSYADFESAFLEAMAAGSNKEAAAQMAAVKNEEKAETPERLHICPLAIACGELRNCVRNSCAWWIKGEEQCAIKRLGASAVNGQLD